MAPFTRPVTVVKRTRGLPDAFGNDTWTTSASVVRGVFAPGASVEQIQGQDTLVTQPIVYLPAGTDVTHLDAVVVDGVTYEVDGSPSDWTHALTGWRPGIEVRLRRAT
jgi:hypothetical protein